MSAVQDAAAAYMAARKAMQDARVASMEAEFLFVQTEAVLIDAVTNHPCEEGEAIIADGGIVLVLKEEYWDIPRGSRFAVVKLIDGAV